MCCYFHMQDIGDQSCVATVQWIVLVYATKCAIDNVLLMCSRCVVKCEVDNVLQ